MLRHLTYIGVGVFLFVIHLLPVLQKNIETYCPSIEKIQLSSFVAYISFRWCILHFCFL